MMTFFAVVGMVACVGLVLALTFVMVQLNKFGGG